ncbi:DUF6113 family protein [Streptomyces sp. AM 4-1-1]|uniref:DUF6113 family protein n=1 Tax=Streptomyces sp. AM 4-1-1 TaxID=3028710 RepID=UPI0023BA1E9C|nr:DUF6113 family protein [Streptomyces sp. AM 4-1-1]WEH35677.1 DUF6113 family protein [Streptomyces sp. AM 4-1-1]
MSSDDRPRARSAGAPPTGARPTGPAAPPDFGRIAAHVGLLVLGALVGLAGALVQAAWFPGGLLLALAAAAGLFLGGRRLTGTQFGALTPAAGWLVSVMVLLGGRPEGDYVFGDELGLALFMLGGAAIAVMCATMSRLPRPDVNTGRAGT